MNKRRFSVMFVFCLQLEQSQQRRRQLLYLRQLV